MSKKIKMIAIHSVTVLKVRNVPGTEFEIDEKEVPRLLRLKVARLAMVQAPAQCQKMMAAMTMMTRKKTKRSS